MKSFQTLIRKVRKGQVVLWIGAGLSVVAGYPSSKELAKIIKENVQPKDKQFFQEKFSLEDVASEFEIIYDRERLLEILNEVFSKQADLNYHEILSQIPQFQEIVTTNYDHLLEWTYGNAIIPIITDDDLTNPNRKNSINIYKIHGDISYPQSILISKDDILKFYEQDKENLIWSEITHLISSNSVLFIGYSLEDRNIRFILDHIKKHLGKNHGDLFLLAPDIPKHNIRDLVKRYNINYINESAEKAIPRIQREVHKNLIRDMESGFVHPKQVAEYLKKYDILPKIEWGLNNPKLSAIRRGNTEIGLSLTFKDDKKSHELHNLLSGATFGQLILTKKDADIKMNLSLLGIEIPSTKKRVRFQSYPVNVDIFPAKRRSIFQSTPILKTTANMVLKKSQNSLTNLDFEIYQSTQAFCMKIFNKFFSIKINRDIHNVFTIRLNVKKITDVFLNYQIFSFLKHFYDGDTLRIFAADHESPIISINGKDISMNDRERNKIFYVSDFYRDLFNIQNIFDIQFDLSLKLNDRDIDNIRTVAMLLNGEKVPINNLNVSSFEVKSDKKGEFLEILKSPSFEINYSDITFRILNKDIVVPNCTAIIEDPELEKWNDIIKQLEISNIFEGGKIKSRINQSFIFSKDFS